MQIIIDVNQNSTAELGILSSFLKNLAEVKSSTPVSEMQHANSSSKNFYDTKLEQLARSAMLSESEKEYLNPESFQAAFEQNHELARSNTVDAKLHSAERVQPLGLAYDIAQQLDTERDASGQSWDKRIHVKTQAKDSNGNWRLKPSVEKKKIEQVQSEYPRITRRIAELLEDGFFTLTDLQEVQAQAGVARLSELHADADKAALFMQILEQRVAQNQGRI